ncbi:cAMP-dependent protein kinase, catalytic subunit-like isoform X2 [Daphnia pulex]|uniref:cAMP-dependent protein kinase, catalytic subunit-like isoform X2 n=1 Tax=Daphnia pulex TaxID=6669 RepID=UPI001EE04A4B|nr:cAMP-dependent protein kinase, catalytic subunit-like isoform X2 [Daphnia pulex]
MFSSWFRKIQIERQVPIGEGGFSLVLLGKFNGHEVAVKKVELRNVNNEEIVLKQLDHPNVIKLFYSESDANFKYFALELCRASLDQLFLKPDHPRKYKGPKLPHHLTVFIQLATGLEYIHSKNLIHRDIKPANVLISVDSDGLVTIKWADFGLSRFVNERGTCTLSGIKGTMNWFAPELLRSIERDDVELGRGTVKSDVFALALVFGYLLLGGQHLYGQEIEVPINIVKQATVNMEKIDNSHYARDLLCKMLEDESGKRISSFEVANELKSIKNEKEEELRRMCWRTSLDLEKIKLLIQRGIDVNGKDNNERNALHFLCRYNSSDKLRDAIKLLIQLGIDVNGKDNDGWNALHSLCLYNSSEELMDAIKLLTQFGIDVNGKDNNGRNALHLMCLYNSNDKLMDAIKLLIQLGIDVNGKDNDGWNALHFLCLNNSSEKLMDAIKLLIQLGIDVNGKDNNGWNALHYLCSNNSSDEKLLDAIKLLIQLGIEVNLTGFDARSLLHRNEHIRENIEKIIEFLDRAAISHQK